MIGDGGRGYVHASGVPAVLPVATRRAVDGSLHSRLDGAGEAGAVEVS